jgi:energy-coupling factor transporter ATP-binding protein EcfA2
MSRTFEDSPAVRSRVPLLIGLTGASGSGKTFSALELATGIQRVTGGDIGYVDTEAKRALHYADTFKFRHLPFGSPFGPIDYLAAIEHFVSKGVRTIVVDSMSHEHEGPGGVLEMHEAEAVRLAAQWKTSLDAVKMSAWQKPKSERRRLLNAILQMPANFVFCFRAKEKLKIVAGQKPKPLGWMPIAGEEFVYEMTLNCLLYPGSNGVPSWHPEELGEKAIIKLPAQFKGILGDRQPLTRDIGEKLAKWAEGGAAEAGDAERRGLLDEVRRLGLARHPGNTEAARQKRAAMVGEAFGAATWKDMDLVPIEKLREGLAELRQEKTEREPGADDETTDDDLFAAEKARELAAAGR